MALINLTEERRRLENLLRRLETEAFAIEDDNKGVSIPADTWREVLALMIVYRKRIAEIRKMQEDAIDINLDDLDEGIGLDDIGLDDEEPDSQWLN